MKYYLTIAAVIFKSSDTKKELVPHSGVIANLIKKVPFLRDHNDPVSLHKQVQETELTEYPFFSVQIPLYNEKKVANRVTAAAAAMDYPNFEVLVCDDSTDETTQLLYDKWNGHPFVKIIHRTIRSGFKGAALDNALKIMDPRTEYVVVFDADFVPYPDTLMLFAKYFKVIAQNERNNTSSTVYLNANQVVKDIQAAQYLGKTVAVQGYQWHVLNKSENWITRAVRSEFAGSYIIERSGGQVFGLLKQIAGSVYAINAKVLKEVGWGTSITEDFQLTLKLYEQGYKVAYTPYIQAPSECVSTLKRLIRQRQRWAEGHSFNIKKHIFSLIKSDNMTAKEKWEAVYLTPYYLQAFIFIFGSLCWIIAETILKVRLPFWTTTLGWSLVLTNLFSLPLMNTVGLFLEEGEERDYLGIFSFITLCYVLAPFIGFAALKGFLEKEEGPWFRTPKSGHITDKINRSVERKRDKLSKYIPWIKPLVGVLNSILPEKTEPSQSPYLAYATASNGFNNFVITNKSSKIKKRIMHTVIVLALTVTTIANIAQTTIPQVFANPDTYYVHETTADNRTDTANDRRLLGDTTIGTGGGAGTVTYEESSTNSTSLTNPTAISTSGSLTGVTNNLYLAVVSAKGYETVSSISGLGLTWSRIQRICGGRDQTGLEIWKALGTPSGNGAVTANFSVAPSSAVIAAYRYSGVDSSTPIGNTTGLNSNGVFNTDQDPNGANCSGGTDASSWSTSLTTTASNSVIFAGVALRNRTATPGAGYTERDDLISGGGGNDAGLATEEQTFATTGSKTVNGTISGTVDYASIAIELKAGSSTATQTLSSTNPTMYMITDNLNKRWTSDTEINDSNTTGDRRNVAIATDSTGNTTAVWEDSRSTNSTQDKFTTTVGGLVRGRYSYAATNLLDGRALIAGGYSDTTASYESSAEVYDPVTNTFSLLSTNLATMRYTPESVTLNDGRVLIAGGRSATNTVLSSTDIFDPNTNTFSAGPNMSTARTNFQMIKINNGKVLAITGCTTYASGSCSASTSTAELFDPTTGTWTATGSLSINGQAGRAVLLQNGEVLEIENGSTTHRYNPVTGTWRKTGTLLESRSLVTLAPTLDGKVLAVGGFSSDYTSTAEVYDPTSETWTTIAPLGAATYGIGSGGLFQALGNGKILMAGFDNGGGAATNSIAELYDPLTGTHTVTTNPMTSPRGYIEQVLLPNGSVLIAGGWNGTSSTTTADIYSPVTYDIYAQKYDKTGTKLWNSGTDIRVNTDDGNRVSTSGPPNYNHLNPTVGLDSSGNAIIAWEEQRDGVFSSSVWSQKLNTSTGAKMWPMGTQDQIAKAPGKMTYIRTASDKEGAIATPLNNGKILITGTNSTTQTQARSTAEIYDTAGRTFTAVKMQQSRYNHSATPLLNGKVLLAGGQVSVATSSTAELYDPVTNTFVATSGTGGFISGGRQKHNATLLKNGKVLLTGGESSAGVALSSSVLFDPTTNTFSAGPNMARTHKDSSAVLLPNGKVLIHGDSQNGAGATAADLFDPIANTFTSVPGATSSRGWNSLLLLNNGKVLSTGANALVSTAELYDPALNTWTSGGVMAAMSKGNTNMVLMPNGKVLQAGGWDNGGNAATNDTKIYDPAANTWTNPGNAPTLTSPFIGQVYSPLNNKIFLVKNTDSASSTTAELYTPVADMPVSTYDYKQNEALTRANLGSLNGIEYKKPKIAVNSSGDATIAWQDNKIGRYDFQGNSYGFVNTAYSMFGANPAANAQCFAGSGCGAQPVMMASPVQILSQKICNQTSCGIAGTTSGERQWGNDQANNNKNNPEAKPVANIKNAMNVAIVSDGTSMAAIYESDSGSVNQSTRTKKIYMQKLDVNGLPALSNNWSTSTGNISEARYQNTSTLLNDGKVLISGGESNGGIGLSTAEVYNPLTQTSTVTTNRMTIGRMNHTSTLLSNGQVLIAGGGASSAAGSSSANIYNPATGTFTATTGNMIGNRNGHTATLMRNGRVLLAGGKNGTSTTYLSSAETFNPATGTFTAITGNMQAARAGHAASLLPDGRVMLAGGSGSASTPAVLTVNAYDPVAGTSTALTSMSTSRTNFTLTLLNNGKVLAVGGYNNSNVRLSSAEIYDPLTNSWTNTVNSLRTGNRSDHAATLLPDGRVLITGGSNGTTNFSTTEIFDPVTGTFTAGANLSGARAYHSNVVTPDGKVIVIGGSSATDTTTTSTAATAGTAPATTNWTTTSGALQAAFASSDNNYGIYNNTARNVAVLSNFGLSIPSNANITGVTALVEGNGAGTGVGLQYEISLTKDATSLAGTAKTGQAFTGATDATITSPSAAATLDTWGNNGITPTEANATGFGFRIRDNDALAAALNFDQVQMQVTYTTNSNVLSSAEIYDLNQKISTADSTDSKNPDLVKDSSGNYQAVWQAWRSEGLSPGASGGSWKIMTQELNNPTSGNIIKQYPSGSPGTWSAAANMNVERLYPIISNVTNGKVLVTGGERASLAGISGGEVYDPQTNTWTATANSMSTVHAYGAGSVNLKSGKTMIVAGKTSWSTVELYDPYTNTFSSTGNITATRGQFGNPIVLNNNKVLIAGGTDFGSTIRSSSEIYDPSTGTWTVTTGNMVGKRKLHQMVKLNNGNVLAIGGCSTEGTCTSTVLTTVELFNPNTNTWSTVSGLNTARSSFTANLLNNGKVLVVGGQTNGGGYLSSAELYDPNNNTWTATTNMPFNQFNDVSQTTSIVLPNGKVLVNQAYATIYDPIAETWSSTGAMIASRGGATMTLLKTGKILSTNGYDNSTVTVLSTAELYTPDLSEKIVSTDDSGLNSDQIEPKISADTSNSYAYVGWTDNRFTAPSDTSSEQNIYMQKLDGNGNPTWPNGLGEGGSYNVRDVRIDTTRGSLNTTVQTKVALAKSVFTNTAADVPVQIAWTDTRDGTPTTSIYGQSYNTRNYSMTSTNWTAYYYVTGSPSSANSISVQVGAAEADGETMSYTSAASTYTGNGTNGEKSTVFSNLPPSTETSLTNRRLVMKLTRVTGSMQIQYNGASTVADTRLDVGTVVPERSLMLVLIIPALPLLAFGGKKYRIYKRRK